MTLGTAWWISHWEGRVCFGRHEKATGGPCFLSGKGGWNQLVRTPSKSGVNTSQTKLTTCSTFPCSAPRPSPNWHSHTIITATSLTSSTLIMTTSNQMQIKKKKPQQLKDSTWGSQRTRMTWRRLRKDTKDGMENASPYLPGPWNHDLSSTQCLATSPNHLPLLTRTPTWMSAPVTHPLHLHCHLYLLLPCTPYLGWMSPMAISISTPLCSYQFLPPILTKWMCQWLHNSIYHATCP